jgi:hypothetical protein
MQQEEDSDDNDGKAHLGKNKRPDLIGTRPCERFLNGHCNFGKDCWFVHDVEAREQALAKASGGLSPSGSGIQLKLGSEEDPPKPKISLAPTNPWGRKEDEFADTAGEVGEMESPATVSNDLLHQLGDDRNRANLKLADRHSRSHCDSSLPPATPSTNPALGVFSVVDMLANVRTGLFEDAISRGVCISRGGPVHDRSEAM